uniref:F-box associated beta-propeller type 1 domain-containing protein n=1 Tax=Quercus lobata TaxID=97700 RepID=A0A7N2KP30_QUELO
MKITLISPNTPALITLSTFHFMCERLCRWNPCVRKLVNLPSPSATYNRFLGFGFDPKAKDYRVVRFVTASKDRFDLANPQLKVKVYSLSSDEWRVIRTGDERVWCCIILDTIFTADVDFGEVMPRPIGFRRNGDAVLVFNEGKLVSWNPESKEFKDLRMIEDHNTFVDSYIKSLVLLDKAANGAVLARDENALLNRRGSSDCDGVSVIRSLPTAERERKHVHAVAYGLIHTRKNIGSEAPNAPTNFLSAQYWETKSIHRCHSPITHYVGLPNPLSFVEQPLPSCLIALPDTAKEDRRAILGTVPTLAGERAAVSFDFGAYDAQVAVVRKKKREAKKRRKACWGERERGWSDFLASISRTVTEDGIGILSDREAMTSP